MFIMMMMVIIMMTSLSGKYETWCRWVTDDFLCKNCESCCYINCAVSSLVAGHGVVCHVGMRSEQCNRKRESGICSRKVSL